jgi:citrate lyase subunit beta/citryl-CoA lyase
MHALLLIDLTFADTIASVSDTLVAGTSSPLRAKGQLQRLCARTRVFLSLGPLDSPTFDDDLAVATAAPIAGIALPHCRNGADLQHLAAKLTVAEAENDRTDGELGIIALVAGTPAAALKLDTLVGASNRLRALVFDGASLGLAVPRDSAPFAAARAMSVLAASAAGVPAYAQMVGQNLTAYCEAARRDGFAGLLTFQAADIPIIERAFSR